MYVKRYVVTRGAKRYAYLRLVESYRDERGRPRHRIVANLGREEELKASGQLEQLAGAFARLDPPLVGVRREVGPAARLALPRPAGAAGARRSPAAAAGQSPADHRRGGRGLALQPSLCSFAPLRRRRLGLGRGAAGAERRPSDALER